MLKLTDKIARSRSTAAEALEGDHLIVDLDSGRYHSAGAVGGFIWEQLDGERELSAIAVGVAQEFDVELERARTDLLAFVEQLLEHGLATRLAE